MKILFISSLSVAILALSYCIWVEEIKSLLVLFIFAYTGIMYSGYRLWKSPKKILQDVDWGKVYKFHRKRGNSLFLVTVNTDQHFQNSRGERIIVDGKVAEYNGKGILIDPMIKESATKTCTLALKPGRGEQLYLEYYLLQ